MTLLSLPCGYPRIKQVYSFHELASTPFQGGVNAMFWQRQLEGDYGEMVSLLNAGPGITTLEDEDLLALPASPAGRVAIAQVLEDLRRLRALELDPVLDCINGYLRDEGPGPVQTDVFSWHVDSATVEADTWLCTYHGACSEGLRNDEALRRVDIPATRAELFRIYGGEDDAAFAEYLNDHCFDLHYVPVSHAQPFRFGQGNLWRIATEYPGCPVPPCIHRAPDTRPGDTPRLLLIS